jgi:hypothetical protein
MLVMGINSINAHVIPVDDIKLSTTFHSNLIMLVISIKITFPHAMKTFQFHLSNFPKKISSIKGGRKLFQAISWHNFSHPSHEVYEENKTILFPLLAHPVYRKKVI